MSDRCINDENAHSGGDAVIDDLEQLEDPERRTVLRFTVTSAFASVAGMILGLYFVRMPMPAILPGPSSRIKLGLLARFPLGIELILEDEQLYVKRDEAGISAMSTVCTHLGCAVRKTEEGFLCPCHGSKYTNEGKVVAGPAPRTLDWYPVRLLPGDRVMVDKSRPTRPGTKTRIG